jgi:hypothetical protein
MAEQVKDIPDNNKFLLIQIGSTLLCSALLEWPDFHSAWPVMQAGEEGDGDGVREKRKPTISRPCCYYNFNLQTPRNALCSRCLVVSAPPYHTPRTPR